MVLLRRPSSEAQDEERVRRAQAGDPRAFAELVQAHDGEVRRVALGIVRNDEDAGDVAQDAWVRVAANLPSLRDAQRFQPWLRRIARNASLDFVQRRARMRTDVDDDALEGIADDDIDTPESRLLSRDEQRKVWEALGRLSESDRSILHEREHEGLPYEEIGRRLGIARNTAEVRVFRAKERFRTQYRAAEAAGRGCGVSALELSALVSGDLGEESRDRVQGHLFSCDDCREQIQAMRAGRRLYRGLIPAWWPAGTEFGVVGQLQALVAKGLSLIGFGGATGGAAAGSAASGASAIASMTAASGAATTAVGAGAATTV
ncbi:MAG: sigma-70 family RNA polymerase sigma factor, partial [Dehalococcoidia bacterium]